MRPDQGAGNQESCNGWKAKLMEDKNDRGGNGEDDQQISEDFVIVHTLLSIKPSIMTAAWRNAAAAYLS